MAGPSAWDDHNMTGRVLVPVCMCYVLFLTLAVSALHLWLLADHPVCCSSGGTLKPDAVGERSLSC